MKDIFDNNITMIEKWRNSFKTDSFKAICDMFSGRAGLCSSLHRNVSIILCEEFPCHLPKDNDFSDVELSELQSDRICLDEALLKWIIFMKNDKQHQIERLSLEVYALRICEALRAIIMIELPFCIEKLSSLKDEMMPFFTDLCIDTSRDTSSEYEEILLMRNKLS